MACKVYVESLEIACKASSGKAVLPPSDVCLSPPTPPSPPAPIPYPNIAEAKNTQAGSKDVKVHGQPAVLRNKSYFNKSKGNTAATRNLGMGVVSHTIEGNTYFSSWSNKVLIEGNNAARHFDLTSHNDLT